MILIIDFNIIVVSAERRRHATLPYGMFLTRVFIRAQLPLDGHKTDNKRPITTMKTFSALGLKPQGQEKQKEKESKKKKNAAVATAAVVPSTKKTKSKPSKEGKKKKKRRETSLSTILDKRRKGRRRWIKLAEEPSSSLKVDDEKSAIVTDSIKMAYTATTLATPPAS